MRFISIPTFGTLERYNFFVQPHTSIYNKDTRDAKLLQIILKNNFYPSNAAQVDRLCLTLLQIYVVICDFTTISCFKAGKFRGSSSHVEVYHKKYHILKHVSF